MIHITNKYNCCGCGACLQVCPHNCIEMCEDEEGFLYPKVNVDTCVDCGLCEKVCPVLNTGEAREPLNVYAAKNPDEIVRLASSSGGVFSMLAEKIINQSGIVFGAMWNEKWEVVHGSSENIEDIYKFRGSKYVQSYTGNTFKEVKDALNEGRKVLFSGTPCQVAGLRLYLHKEYENLLTVDFVCHGVPSPGVFRWHLQEEINNYARSASKNSVSLPPIHNIPKGDVLVPEGIEIKDISFRDKRKGWKKYSFALTLAEALADGKQNTVSLSKCCNDYTWLKGFDLYLRPSCFKCVFRSLRSGSDITIADYWGVHTLLPDFDDDKGVSALLTNTEKGQKFIDQLDIIKNETTYQELCRLNSALLEPSKENTGKRMFFYDKGRSLSFKERVDYLTKVSLWTQLKALPHKVIKGFIIKLLGDKSISKIRKAFKHVNR